MDKHVVLIRREWHSPKITVHVTTKAIEVEMKLQDFLLALVEESGNPALLLTKAGLREHLQSGAESVLRKMKSETAKVM